MIIYRVSCLRPLLFTRSRENWQNYGRLRLAFSRLGHVSSSNIHTRGSYYHCVRPTRAPSGRLRLQDRRGIAPFPWLGSRRSIEYEEGLSCILSGSMNSLLTFNRAIISCTSTSRAGPRYNRSSSVAHHRRAAALLSRISRFGGQSHS